MRRDQFPPPVEVLLAGIEGAARAGNDAALLDALATIQRGAPPTPLLGDKRPLAWQTVLQRVVSILERFYGMDPPGLGCPKCGMPMFCPGCTGRRGGRPKGSHTEAQREQARQMAAKGRAALAARRARQRGEG